jgi:hypothetical protein
MTYERSSGGAIADARAWAEAAAWGLRLETLLLGCCDSLRRPDLELGVCWSGTDEAVVAIASEQTVTGRPRGPAAAPRRRRGNRRRYRGCIRMLVGAGGAYRSVAKRSSS